MGAFFGGLCRTLFCRSLVYWSLFLQRLSPVTFLTAHGKDPNCLVSLTALSLHNRIVGWGRGGGVVIRSNRLQDKLFPIMQFYKLSKDTVELTTYTSMQLHGGERSTYRSCRICTSNFMGWHVNVETLLYYCSITRLTLVLTLTRTPFLPTSISCLLTAQVLATFSPIFNVVNHLKSFFSISF
jgi:hypothetical protein